MTFSSRVQCLDITPKQYLPGLLEDCNWESVNFVDELYSYGWCSAWILFVYYRRAAGFFKQTNRTMMDICLYITHKWLDRRYTIPKCMAILKLEDFLSKFDNQTYLSEFLRTRLLRKWLTKTYRLGQRDSVSMPVQWADITWLLSTEKSASGTWGIWFKSRHPVLFVWILSDPGC